MVDEVLKIRSLSKSYVPGIKILDDVSFSVKRGEFLALLGPNGAGKSTLISIVSSLLRFDAGEVTINGFDLLKDSFYAKREVGLMPQEFNFNQFEPIEEILINQAGFYGIPAPQARINTQNLLERFLLIDRRRDLPISLSGGMKRRLMLARMLVSDPDLIILDEPTAGVDVEIRRFVWDLLMDLNKQGKTVILTTHYLEEAEQLCNKLALINHGKLIYHGLLSGVTAMLRTSTYVLQIKPGQMTQAEHILRSESGLDVRPDEDGQHLDIDVCAGTDLAEPLAQLNQHGISLLGIRFRRSPLEEVFVQLTGPPQSAATNHHDSPAPNEPSAEL